MNKIKLVPSLLIFAEIAKNLSFTKAARHLSMSKSAVSQQLKKLESDIGQQLITRTTRGMSLTEAGVKLLKRSELLGDQVELAFQEISASKSMPTGRFAITIPHSFEQNIAIPALAQLCQEFPGIQPDLQVTDHTKDLANDNLDVAVYGGVLKDSDYRALPIGSANEVVCASPIYIARTGSIDSLEVLKRSKWVLTPWQKNPMILYKDNQLLGKETIPISVAASSNTLSAAVELVKAHMGIGLFPEFILQKSFAAGKLVRVNPNYQGKQWPFYFVHRFKKEKPIHISRCYELIKFYFNRVVNQ